ncbi:MAG TPA: ferrochelatase [Oligoflexia bacterium]|nr:ferrochelatase [Oligoflexia bacterium]HMR24043.1 ferrochelatase [Oligoflexia bacterium]
MSPLTVDALMLVSFGGPEKNEDVMPFLNNVLKGKPVSEERKKQVAEHYYLFDGKSPINEQNLALIECIKRELEKRKIDLPIYFANRNWQPYIHETIQKVVQDHRKKTLCMFTSAFSSYSGCRQYRNNLEQAKADLEQSDNFEYEVLRKYYNHPKFIECIVERFKEQENNHGISYKQADTKVLFTAHSIPMAMANSSDYVLQLEESCHLVAQFLGLENWELVYQSRSGSPHIPWLEPDVCERIGQLSQEDSRIKNLYVCPIGFISDHMEVIYDLDMEAKTIAAEQKINFIRVLTPGTHPIFVSMLVDLVEEVLYPQKNKKLAIGNYPAREVCPPNCCEWERRG